MQRPFFFLFTQPVKVMPRPFFFLFTFAAEVSGPRTDMHVQHTWRKTILFKPISFSVLGVHRKPSRRLHHEERVAEKFPLPLWFPLHSASLAVSRQWVQNHIPILRMKCRFTAPVKGPQRQCKTLARSKDCLF